MGLRAKLDDGLGLLLAFGRVDVGRLLKVMIFIKRRGNGGTPDTSCNNS